MRTACLLLAALSLAALSLVALAACGEATGPDRAEPPRPLTSQEAELAATGSSFGLTLFRTVSEAEEEPNVFVSPLSVSMALGMTLNGADGETYAAMRQTLAMEGLSREEINASYHSLVDLLRGLDPAVAFAVANSIWHREGFAVEQSFVDTNREHFDAEVAALDFGAPGASETINAWVDDATQGKIETIVPAAIPPDVVMYLINAIYFKGAWTHQFDEEATRKAVFTRDDGAGVEVDMMHLEPTSLPHYRGEGGLRAVDLPYGDSLYSMTVLLPEGETADELAARLDASLWQAVTEGLRPQEMAVHLPRFELEYEKSLNDVLTAMGMGVAFSGAADFSRINPGAALRISEVKHKTFVAVDEEGTEAAAATSVAIVETSAPPAFRADRPFVFAIRERHSGTILFVGRVGDPTAD